MDIDGTGLEIPVAVLKDLGCQVSVDLFLASEIPPGTGLGSSASVCVNVLKTLCSYVHLPLSKHELAERSFHVARNVLRRHVGKQDEYAAAFGGLNYMAFAKDGTTQVAPLELEQPEVHQQVRIKADLLAESALLRTVPNALPVPGWCQLGRAVNRRRQLRIVARHRHPSTIEV